tara:strand:- start:118 stop:693 length:576 start_codon:yes stop_codon:yes gene_type:complete
MNKDWILIIDLETTDLSEKVGFIVEVGITALNVMTGERKILMDSVCHQTGITKEACDKSWVVNNSTLTTEAIRRSPNFNLLGVQEIIDEYPRGITAFNSNFDFKHLRAAGIIIKNEIPCIMKSLTKEVGAVNKLGRVKWPKVDEAWQYFFKGEDDYVETHRGGDDAYHEAALAFKGIELGLIIIPLSNTTK